MQDTKFDKLIALLEPLEKDSIGEWIIDKEHRETTDDPVQMPYIRYTEIVKKFIDAVYGFAKEYPEYELSHYRKLLKARGIEVASKDMRKADISGMDAQGIMALLVGVVRSERFCDGIILEMMKSGAVKNWILRLKELQEEEDV